MDYLVSGRDIKRVVGDRYRIIEHSKIRHVHDVDDLFDEDTDAVFVFYRFDPDVGHWTVLIKINDREYYFFDSYGGTLLQQYETLRKEYNTEPYLIRLMLKEMTDRDIKFKNSRIRYQRKKDGINTCGKHSLLRVYMNSLDNEQYHKVLRSMKKRYKFKNYDELAVRFYDNINK